MASQWSSLTNALSPTSPSSQSQLWSPTSTPSTVPTSVPTTGSENFNNRPLPEVKESNAAAYTSSQSPPNLLGSSVGAATSSPAQDRPVNLPPAYLTGFDKQGNSIPPGKFLCECGSTLALQSWRDGVRNHFYTKKHTSVCGETLPSVRSKNRPVNVRYCAQCDRWFSRSDVLIRHLESSNTPCRLPEGELAKHRTQTSRRSNARGRGGAPSFSPGRRKGKAPEVSPPDNDPFQAPLPAPLGSSVTLGNSALPDPSPRLPSAPETITRNIFVQAANVPKPDNKLGISLDETNVPVPGPSRLTMIDTSGSVRHQDQTSAMAAKDAHIQAASVPIRNAVLPSPVIAYDGPVLWRTAPITSSVSLPPTNEQEIDDLVGLNGFLGGRSSDVDGSVDIAWDGDYQMLFLSGQMSQQSAFAEDLSPLNEFERLLGSP